MNGKIKRVMEKGFGFIQPANGRDVFFHATSLVDCEFEEIVPGMKVTFDIEDSDRGQRAKNVRKV